MRIAVIGGGPGGLYFAALAKQLGPASHEITVWERNAADDTFGFGVVFSDETLGGIEHADPVVHAQMEREFARWDDIDVHFRGEVVTSGGHGFAAMGRKRLLQILQERCRELGRGRALPAPRRPTSTQLQPRLRPGRRVPTGSTPRSAPSYADVFGPTLDVRRLQATCGWAPTRSSRPSRSTSARPRTASCRCTATRSTRTAARSSSRCTRTCGAGPASTHAGATCAPGESDERSVAAVREMFADVLDGARGAGQQLAVDQLHHRHATSAGATTTSCCSATPRTPRTSPSARAPSWPWRTRCRWRPACTRPPTSPPRSPPTRRSASRSCSPPSAPRRRAWSGSRTSASTSTRSRCSSRSTSSPAAGGSPTTTCACATREFIARVDDWFAADPRPAR